jgi:predicted nuclease of predicted toxin-antitoxin system
VIVWVDAQLSPALAPWLIQEFGISAFSIRRLGLVSADDEEIFRAARTADVVVLTKDSDFVRLLDRFGPPPRVLWIRCGNTSNDDVRVVIRQTLATAMKLFAAGEALVELTDSP